MSRSVKDLRELICVSRLSLRLSDDDESDVSLSDNEALSDTARNTKIKQLLRPDTALSVRDERPSKQQKQQQKQQQQEQELKKKQPLPPLQRQQQKQQRQQQQQKQQQQRYELMMKFIDEKAVADLLKSANVALEKLRDWTRTDLNFIHFANFWLTDFPDSKKSQIFQLEYSCLQDHFAFVFRSGISSNKLNSSDVQHLLEAIFREYPKHLQSPKAAHLFLNHLDTLTVAKGDQYKQLLTDVRLSTDNRNYAELLLAMRSFCLSSVWSAILAFYQQLVNRGDVVLQVADVATFGDVTEQRIVMSISLGYVDVLHYLILTGRVDPYEFTDRQNRSLIFIAVSCAQHRADPVNQIRILKYLLKRLQPNPPVHTPANTGNTALHCAVSGNSLEMVQLLVKHGGADVNAVNDLCDSCTPLHLAVMYGHTSIAIYLLENGATVQSKMGSMDCLQLAKMNADDEMIELLQKYSA